MTPPAAPPETTDPLRKAAREMLTASDEDDGEFNGARLDRLRDAREALRSALSSPAREPAPKPVSVSIAIGGAK